MMAICRYMRCTKVIIDYWDIRLLELQVLLAIISGMTKQISIIKVVLEITHQIVSNNILIYRDTSISI